MESLLELLKTLGAPVYEIAAPQGEPRCIVAHAYGLQGIPGDDSAFFPIVRVQLDVWTQDPRDTLPRDVLELLRVWYYPAEVEGYRLFDDEAQLLRTVILTEVIE